ncbi:GM10696 [Drosophila sechellia]|uniref:GM10696 n=1 Tax=Drosophila sechellia TaxID=7238 RepID=B4I3Q2_DROSE|nr:GM10696 [Drosophila sechellia]
MKLTTCQIAKLFPLLTAFFFLNSPSAASLSFGLSPTFASASSSLSLSPSSSSHFHSERPLRSDVLVLRAAKPVRAFATNADAATRPVPATAAATTLGSKSIWPTAIQTKSPRNAREAGRHKRQMQQPAIQQQPLQQQQQRINPPQQKRQQQQVQHKTQRVGVLIPASLHVDLTHVQQGFQNFLDFFQLHLFNVTVDFLRDVGEYTQAEKQTHQDQAKHPCLPCLLPQP